MRFLLFALVLIATGCGEPESTKTSNRPAGAPVAVKITIAARSAWPSTYEATGTVQARTSATVSARVMGYAREVRAQIGDHVAAGQILVVLDAHEHETAIRQAEAMRDEVKSAIPEAESAMAAARAQADLAQVTFKRMQDLLNKRSVTQQEFDEASARLKAAQSAYDMARSRRAQFDAKLAQTEQALRAANIQKAYTTVTAPFPGVILAKSIEPGTLVVPGAPLFTMERGGAYRLEANVEESQLAAIRTGQAVEVKIDSSAASVAGRVGEIVPAVDAASRTGIVKIDLPAAPHLRSGLFGRAVFATGQREALTMPKKAVVERGSLQSVFVIDGKVARLRLVTLGSSTGDRVEVLSGLNEGESVASSAPSGLKDGALVEVRQ